MNLVLREEYAEVLKQKFIDVLNALPGDEVVFMTELISYKSWLTYSPFVKIMAATDMYLNEFPTHPYALMRLGTIVTRFKDCSMLVACNYLAEILGMTFPEVAQWIWTHTCAKQFNQVLVSGQQVEEARSYSMYFMELVSLLSRPTQGFKLICSYRRSLVRSSKIHQCSHDR